MRIPTTGLVVLMGWMFVALVYWGVVSYVAP